jgi:hypothetical protein
MHINRSTSYLFLISFHSPHLFVCLCCLDARFELWLTENGVFTSALQSPTLTPYSQSASRHLNFLLIPPLPQHSPHYEDSLLALIIPFSSKLESLDVEPPRTIVALEGTTVSCSQTSPIQPRPVLKFLNFWFGPLQLLQCSNFPDIFFLLRSVRAAYLNELTEKEMIDAFEGVRHINLACTHIELKDCWLSGTNIMNSFPRRVHSLHLRSRWGPLNSTEIRDGFDLWKKNRL